jgi:uncharacterized membrane-anchored protein YhcB (DUF1043 family)
VYPLEFVIPVAVGAAVVGVIIGYLASKKMGASLKAQALLQQQIEELQNQQQNYRNEVSDHFVETAQLFNQLTNSYRDVHNHLAESAQNLAGESATNTLAALSDESRSMLAAENDITPHNNDTIEIDNLSANIEDDELEKKSQQTETETETEVIIGRENGSQPYSPGSYPADTDTRQ